MTKKDYSTTIIEKKDNGKKVIKINRNSDFYFDNKQITFEFNEKTIKPSELNICFETVTNPNNNRTYKVVHFMNLCDCTISVFNHDNKNYIIPSTSENSLKDFRLDNYSILVDKLTKTINKAMHGMNFNSFVGLLESSQKQNSKTKEFSSRYIDKTNSNYYKFKNARVAILLKFNELLKIAKTTKKTVTDSTQAIA